MSTIRRLLWALLVVFLAGLFIEFLPFEAAIFLVTSLLAHLGLIRRGAFMAWRQRLRQSLDRAMAILAPMRKARAKDALPKAAQDRATPV